MKEKSKIIKTRKTLIKRLRRKHPNFIRQNSRHFKRFKKNVWKYPRGVHNKIREQEAGKGKMPGIGYGSALIIKHLHPSGYEEIRIENPIDLAKINAETQAARVSSTVGRRKKEMILKKADELNIKVLN